MVTIESFYTLERTPFTRQVPPDACYLSPMLEEVLGRLQYAAERQWFAVVTGDCGVGKTTAIRRFAATLDPARYQVLYVADSRWTPRIFYKGLLEQLGCEASFYRGDAKRQLQHEVERLRAIHHMQPVVIVDEAHLLDRDMLEEIRFLLNFQMDSQSPMALILVGQTELGTRIRLQSFAAIYQRMDLQCHLGYWDRSQVAAYIAAQLHYAGGSPTLFAEGAIDSLYRYSSGAARLINKACTHCLLYGAQNGQRVIDEPIVTRVIQGELA